MNETSSSVSFESFDSARLRFAKLLERPATKILVDAACKVRFRNGQLTEVAWPVQLMESQSRERGIAVVQSPWQSRSVRKEPRRSDYKGKIEIKLRPACSVEEVRKENS